MIRALVVDDDPSVLALHAAVLARMTGVEVAASTGRGSEAAALAAEHAVDLVLLDIGMPDLDGLEVLERLRAAPSAPAVLMVTAVADRESVQRAVRGGVDDYLVKPFPVEELQRRVERVRDVVEARRAAQPLSQDQIDRMLRGDVAPTPDPALPKGFAAPTLDLVQAALAQAPAAVGAAEIADLAGLSRVSARRYLDLLVERGQARVDLEYGTAGRPRHRYRRA